jgi:hypothetical protein
MSHSRRQAQGIPTWIGDQHPSALLADRPHGGYVGAALSLSRTGAGAATALLAALFTLEELTPARLIERHLSHYGVLETWDSLMSACIAASAVLRGLTPPATHKRVDR